MLQRRSRKKAHRENQRRYAARLRDGIGLYPLPLGCREIDLLIALGWLPEGEEANRQQVGEAVAVVIREVRHACDVCFSNRPVRVKRFQTIHHTMSMSLAGSRFSSESAPRPYHHGIRRRDGTIPHRREL